MTSTFIEVEPQQISGLSHSMNSSTILAENSSKPNRRCPEVMNVTDSSIGNVLLLIPQSSLHYLEGRLCNHHSTESPPIHMCQMPSKLFTCNGSDQVNGGLICRQCRLVRVELVPLEKYFTSQQSTSRCSICEARERQVPNIDDVTSSSSCSSISHSDDNEYNSPPEQFRDQYFTSPRRSSPRLFTTYGNELHTVHQHRGANRSAQPKDGSWKYGQVKLVYENQQQQSANPQRRARSVFEASRKLSPDPQAIRSNGASMVIYANKPDRMNFRDDPIGRAASPNIFTTSSSESISSSVTSLPEHLPERMPELELDVLSPSIQNPFDGGSQINRITFEPIRPSGVSDFDSSSESSFRLNGEENCGREIRIETPQPLVNAYPDRRITPQSRVDHQEARYVPRPQTTKDPNANKSFHFQHKADLCNSSSSSETPPSIFLPSNTRNERNTLDDVVEIDQEHDDIKDSKISYIRPSMVEEGGYRLPSMASVTPMPPFSMDEIKIPILDGNNTDRKDLKSDPTRQVKAQVGNLIQQRINQMTASLGSESQPQSRWNRSPLRQGPSQSSSNPQNEMMDKFIDQQFGDLTRDRRNLRMSTEGPETKEQPHLVGWKREIDPTYQNLSTEISPERYIDHHALESGAAQFGFTHSIKPGQIVSQRVRELMSLVSSSNTGH